MVAPKGAIFGASTVPTYLPANSSSSLSPNKFCYSFVSTTTNSKGMLSSGGIVQLFLATVVERWLNPVHSDSFLSIGQSSAGKRST